MANETNAQTSDEQKKLEDQVTAAKLNQQLAEAELNSLKAKIAIDALNNPTKQTHAETDKAIAIAYKDATVANKDAILAKRDLFKGPEISAPTGKITTNDGVFIESRILANRTLAECLDKFIKAFTKNNSILNKNISLIVYNPTDIPNLELYASIHTQLNEMESAYDKLNRGTKALLDNNLDLTVPMVVSLGDPLLIGFAASGILKTVADVVSLFKTTTDFKNFDLITDESLIISSLKIAIDNNGKPWKVYNPAVFPMYTINNPSTQSSLFVQKLNTISSQTLLSTQYLTDIDTRIKFWQDKLSVETSDDNKKRITKYIDGFAPYIVQLKALNNSFIQLQTSLAITDVQTKTTAQSLIMRAERLVTKLNEADVYTIKLSATSKGSNKIRENLWTSARISYTAGTEFTCLVFGSDGEIVFADNRYEYTPYTNPKDIKKSSD